MLCHFITSLIVFLNIQLKLIKEHRNNADFYVGFLPKFLSVFILQKRRDYPFYTGGTFDRCKIHPEFIEETLQDLFLLKGWISLDAYY
ncbi:MAG: hypothetical protein A2Y81_03255 [Nitrospirae bacterium RBG_13_43_8]|nr:MAG: hypothetical protein A2Y81_03255 [Nitrospirae bacterium RBG_13_43_8]